MHFSVGGGGDSCLEGFSNFPKATQLIRFGAGFEPEQNDSGTESWKKHLEENDIDDLDYQGE